MTPGKTKMVRFDGAEALVTKAEINIASDQKERALVGINEWRFAEGVGSIPLLAFVITLMCGVHSAIWGIVACGVFFLRAEVAVRGHQRALIAAESVLVLDGR